MGLDLYPAGRPKPGHEAEWERCIQILYDGKEETEEAAKRRFAVSIEAWASIGAPRVGYDGEADAWALTEPHRDTNVSDAEVLKDMHGFYVLELMRGKCDGLPLYTHAGMYNLDETSFRGSFLECCKDLLGEELLSEAWTDCMRPEEAIDYGKRLLAIADRAARGRIGLVGIKATEGSREPSKPGPSGVQRTGLLEIRVGTQGASVASDRKEEQQVSLDEKIDILRSAGHWYVFWGERGHPIVAWF